MPSSRTCILLAAVLSAALASASAIADPRGLKRYLRLQQEIAAYEAKNGQLERDNAALRQEIEALSGDLAALERAAREDLGLVKPGEMVFNFER